MLPSTKSSEGTERRRTDLSKVGSPSALPARNPVVFRVVHLPSGTWLLETTGGGVGGVFGSKHAALTYACAEAEWCPAKSVVIELAGRCADTALADAE